MDRAAADQIDDRVSGFLQLQCVAQFVGEFRTVLGHREGTLVAQEVGRVQEGDMQDMAFDPFAAVQQPAQRRSGVGHGTAQKRLERMAGAHLVGHGTDAADAGGDIGHLGDRPASQQGLEKSRRLEDAQLHVVDPAVAEVDRQSPFALDAGHGRDADGSCALTGTEPSVPALVIRRLQLGST